MAQGIEAVAERSISSTNRLAGAWFGLLNDIYALFYRFGLTLLRIFYKRRRTVIHYFRSHKQRRVQHLEKEQYRLRAHLRALIWEMSAPIRNVRLRYRKLTRELETERRYGTDRRVFKVQARIVWFVLQKFWLLFKFLLSYIAPVVACVFLYNTAQGFLTETYALKLTYNGIEIGNIANESVYNQANLEVRNRMAGEEFFTMQQITPRFELVPADMQQVLSVDELTNLLVQHSGNDLLEASGFYLESTVNGRTQMRLVGAIKDGNALLNYLNTLLEQYRTPEMDNNAQIGFTRKMQLKKGLYPDSALRTLGEISEELNGSEKNELYYRVVNGDTPLRIATKNGISFDELKLLNPSIETNLNPGDDLLISRSVSRMSIKVTTQERVEQALEYRIRQETVPSMDIGWTNVKQKGQEGLQEIISNVVLVDGVEISRTELSKKVLQEPVEEILQVGGNRQLKVVPTTSAGTVPTGTFIWPTVAGSINMPFRGYYGHTGSDISWPGCHGYPILAAADGVVTTAKMYGGSYGNYVVIDHGGGVRTLYAHSSRLDVKVGDQVKQGQQIAAIGSTGRSTGPHLHFEIQLGGTAVNAAPYLTR